MHVDYGKYFHHDGSALYLSDESPELGKSVTVKLRGPHEKLVDRVFLRSVYDGEPKISEAKPIVRGDETWWESELPVRNPRTHYRWLLQGGDVGFGWLNANGFISHDVSDMHDFAVSATPTPPTWLESSVVYQIFPDRFATSGQRRDLPAWAVPRTWGTHPEGRSVNTGVEFFGGDLDGVRERLDYLEDLGVNVIYMTPFFPANSTHRYDATTFDHVDPLLGGDQALSRLIEAAHTRGMKVMGDITLNHCGRNHDWFLEAVNGNAQYRDFFTFDPSLPHGYECWLGVASLPKFNFTSNALIERLITDEQSVIRRWLRFGLDGWRVDVANMAGRQADLDMTHLLARLTREAVAKEGADKALIAEHFHDAGVDLDGTGWHGGMNYAAFMNPIWTWLRADSYQGTWHGIPIPPPTQTATHAVAALRSFSSRMPWRSYRFSWPLLGSHDTARVRTICAGPERQRVAAALLMTLPGTPMIFAGDEIGAEGSWGEDSRTCFPWDDETAWDAHMRSDYQTLIQLRRSSDALARGGLRWIHQGEDLLVFLRESASQRLLIAASRGPVQENVLIPRPAFKGAEIVFGDAIDLTGDKAIVEFERAGVAICELR